MAQVTLGGIVDLGYSTASVKQAGDTLAKTNGMGDGVQNGGRIFFKSNEDLGGGLKAGATLEFAIAPSDKAQSFDSRQTFLSLSGGFGTVSMGRQYSLQHSNQGSGDLMGNISVAGYLGGLDTSLRVSDAVIYTAPAFGGVTVAVEAITDPGNTTGVAKATGSGVRISYAAGPLSATTISQYMVVVRKLLKMAVRRGLLLEMPEFPKVHTKNKPRSMFSVQEYRRLIKTARRLAMDRRTAPMVKTEGGARERFWVPTKYLQLPPDMAWVIAFMVNSFVRPSDIRQLRNKHVEIVRGEHTYLRLNLPESKRHDRPIVTMRPAVRVFEQALSHAQAQGRGGPDDFVFLPELRDRQHALSILGFWFKWVLREAGMAEVDHLNRKRTLYSLRHTAIMYRLLYGQGIDTLTLARNARTSVQMIERFYASSLTGEMNVGMLQSKRDTTKAAQREKA